MELEFRKIRGVTSPATIGDENSSSSTLIMLLTGSLQVHRVHRSWNVPGGWMFPSGFYEWRNSPESATGKAGELAAGVRNHLTTLMNLRFRRSRGPRPGACRVRAGARPVPFCASWAVRPASQTVAVQPDRATARSTTCPTC